MKISALLNSEVEEKFDFRGHTYIVTARPDVYTMDDATNAALALNDMKVASEIIARGIADIGVIVDGKREAITDDKGKKIALTAENLRTQFPENFVLQLSNVLVRLKESTEGKPTAPQE